jgi:hypothetical protein
MTAMTDDSERRLAVLADALGGEPGIGLPGEGGRRGFGAGALTVDGSILAMAVRGALVAMREWVVLGPDDSADLPLAREALAFVREG